MRLKYVDITNFRSIEKVRVELTPPCRVLVGINESGKSNILQALSMISPGREPTKEDIREPLPDELPTIDEAYIRFVFDLDSAEIKDIYNKVSSKVLCVNPKVPILKKSKEQLSLEAFCTTMKQGIYEVDLIKKAKTAYYWSIDESYDVLENWKKPSPACPAEYVLETKTGEKYQLKKFSFINVEDYEGVPSEYLDAVSLDYLDSVVGGAICKVVLSRLPKSLSWVYDEKYLLPPVINLNGFASNPESCIPLENMFILAGITNIQQAINDAAQGPRNSLRNLLTNIANKTTKHFRAVWKEYKSIEFDLELDGENIRPSIRESNRYDFARRSDGFKRFVSFLLIISTKVKTNLITNTLLLIDEPDSSLHPSGARYLKDELIKIAKKNYVIYSTHSIFMIDRDNVGRHIIVKKENEKTSLRDADESNVAEEEVIYNALGYSIFETLQKKNILFEGWRDKKLFQIAIRRPLGKYSKLKEAFKDIGICHARGVRDFKNITPLLELARRECLIVSDGDRPAIEKQKEYKKFRGYGVWKIYGEINSEVNAVTGEDFIKIEVFER